MHTFKHHILIKYLFVFLFANGIFMYRTMAQIVQPITEKFAENEKNLPVEKLYLSFDRPYYAASDTLWFKVFVLNSANKGINMSDRVFVELYNDSAKLVQRKAIALNNGLGNGDFLLESKFKEGTYTIRAYSNWQQNFGSDYFFQKSIAVGNAQRAWRVATRQTMEVVNGNRSLQVFAKLTNSKNKPLASHSVIISVLKNGNKLASKTYISNADGTIDTKINLRDDDKNAILKIADEKTPEIYTLIPIGFKDNTVADIQFMPEGGYLVNNIFSKVAFKAIGADGLAKEASGKIVNSNNETVAKIASEHSGMGNFRLLPVEGETYAAIIEINGVNRRFPLKAAMKEGTILSVDNVTKKDTMLIALKAVGKVNQKDNYELIAQSGEKVVLGLKVNLQRGFFNIKLPTKDLPDGIIHFTLFNDNQNPLNERSVFIPIKKRMEIDIQSKTSYSPLSPISLEISAINEEKQPVRGTFSVAVTDNGQVAVDEHSVNILSHYLLTSNLKGNVEDPSWYLKDTIRTTRSALDNLLLTQGWVGYDPTSVIFPSGSIAFKAESGNSVSGSVVNSLKKPLANMQVTLMALGKTVFISDTITNAEGRFTFSNLPALDSPAFLIKIKNAKGRSSGATISVDEFKSSTIPVIVSTLPPMQPQLDSTVINLYRMSKNRERLADQATIARVGLSIKEIEVKGNNKHLPDSLALDSKLYKQLVEADLLKVPQKDLLALIKQVAPEFHSLSGGYLFGSGPLFSVRADNIMVESVDWTTYFNYLNAEDVKNLNIYRTVNIGRGASFKYFMEITTRSGNGPWMSRAKGNYVFRPISNYSPKEFYSPKYLTDQALTTPDLRTTIFWDANVITDENGKAKISFYAAGNPGSYSVKVEGADLLGRLGFKRQQIIISPKATSK